jgi:hypothetical protein
MATTNQRAARAGVWFGACLVVASVVLSQLRFRGATISQWNGFCTSGIGQFGQIFAEGARRDCGLAQFGDHAIGWMAGIGIAVIVGAAVVYFTSRAPVPPGPPGGWPGQPPSGWQHPPGANPPQGPANMN